MLVSIITRTIDRPSLKDVITAVKNQTYNNIEHIIVRGFDRFNAAAEGFKKAKGEIVLLLDDDDMINETHVENAVKYFNEDIYYVNTGFEMKAKIRKGEKFRKEGREFIKGKTILFTHSSCFFFRSSLLSEFDYLDDKYKCPCEDAAFYFDIASKYKGIFTNRYSSTYIMHGKNTSGLPPGDYFSVEANNECYKTIIKLLKQ